MPGDEQASQNHYGEPDTDPRKLGPGKGTNTQDFSVRIPLRGKCLGTEQWRHNASFPILLNFIR